MLIKNFIISSDESERRSFSTTKILRIGTAVITTSLILVSSLLFIVLFSSLNRSYESQKLEKKKALSIVFDADITNLLNLIQDLSYNAKNLQINPVNNSISTSLLETYLSRVSFTSTFFTLGYYSNKNEAGVIQEDNTLKTLLEYNSDKRYANANLKKNVGKALIKLFQGADESTEPVIFQVNSSNGYDWYIVTSLSEPIISDAINFNQKTKLVGLRFSLDDLIGSISKKAGLTFDEQSEISEFIKNFPVGEYINKRSIDKVLSAVASNSENKTSLLPLIICGVILLCFTLFLSLVCWRLFILQRRSSINLLNNLKIKKTQLEVFLKAQIGGYLLLSSQGKLISSNDQWKKIMKCGGEPTSQTEWGNNIHLEYKNSVMKTWEDAFRLYKNFEETFPINDNEDVNEASWVKVKAVPLSEPQQNWGYILVCSDVTEAMQAEHKTKKLYVMLENAKDEYLKLKEELSQSTNMAGKISGIEKKIERIIENNNKSVKSLEDQLNRTISSNLQKPEKEKRFRLSNFLSGCKSLFFS